MSKITIKGKGILFETRELLYVEPYGENCARVRSTRNSKLSDEKWTLLESENDNSSVESENDCAILRNGKLTVKVSYVWGWCRLEFLRNGKTILVSREDSDPATKYSHVANRFVASHKFQIKCMPFCPYHRAGGGGQDSRAAQAP